MPDQFVKVGNYMLLEKLAVGGMAEVFLAKTMTSDSFNKFVAIKKILPNYADNKEFISLFKEEISVSLNLNHGNIVTHYDFINESGQFYLVMEFVNGINLRQIESDLKFSKAQLSIPQILYIVSQIASGLEYAHRCTEVTTKRKLNIIHRDLSPHNVMVTFDGLVKIIDFGIAKADTQLDATKVGMIKGKFSYMSPEQSKAGALDHRSDLFSLGIIFWELLVKERLYEGKNDFETLKKIRADEISKPSLLNSVISLEIDRIVMKLLEKKPDNRYQNAADLKHDIDQLLSQSYSQFRPAQFTQFIESIYSEIIKSKSEKLIEYSKFKIPDDINQIKNPLQPPPFKTGVTHINVEFPDGFKSTTESQLNEPLNFDKLKNKSPFATDLNTNAKQRAAQFFESSKSKNVIPEEEQAVNRQGSFLGNFKHLFLIFVCCYAAYSFYKEIFNSTELSSVKEAAEKPGIKEVQTESPDVSLFLHKKNLPKEDNYSKEIYKKLKASSQLAYANIVTENLNSADTKVFIDGKIILEKLPVKLYPIYSNRPVKIVCYNAKLNLYDERTITVQAGKVALVKLYMKPYGAHDRTK
jgi:serine/threonine protein kinase